MDVSYSLLCEKGVTIVALVFGIVRVFVIGDAAPFDGVYLFSASWYGAAPDRGFCFHFERGRY